MPHRLAAAENHRQPAYYKIAASAATSGGQGGTRAEVVTPAMLRTFMSDVVKELNLDMKCSCCGTAAAWYEYTRQEYAFGSDPVQATKTATGEVPAKARRRAKAASLRN